jgi:hypothetical protein
VATDRCKVVFSNLLMHYISTATQRNEFHCNWRKGEDENMFDKNHAKEAEHYEKNGTKFWSLRDEHEYVPSLVPTFYPQR